METKNILTADFLDILFDGKNKNYGAYELRKTYDRRMVLAVGTTFFLSLLFVVSSLLAGPKKKTRSQELVTTVELQNVKQDEPKPELPRPQEKPKPQLVEIARVTPPRIVEDDQVNEQDEVKPVDDLQNVRIGNIDQQGVKGDDIIAPPIEKNTGVVDVPKKEDDIDEIFPIVQIQAQFPGGTKEWIRYLERNLNKDIAAENGAPPADYTVTVSFIVDKKGLISDVRAENDPGYGIKAEAIRVIQKGPNWIPAVQNGHNVMYRQKQNITFRVSAQ